MHVGPGQTHGCAGHAEEQPGAGPGGRAEMDRNEGSSGE